MRKRIQKIRTLRVRKWQLKNMNKTLDLLDMLNFNDGEAIRSRLVVIKELEKCRDSVVKEIKRIKNNTR